MAGAFSIRRIGRATVTMCIATAATAVGVHLGTGAPVVSPVGGVPAQSVIAKVGSDDAR